MSDSNIASEVVDIAAKAQAIADYERRFNRPVRDPDLLWSEDGMDADTMDDYRASARAALEAAAPYMFACEDIPAEHDEEVCSKGETLCEECHAAGADCGPAI